MTDINYTADGYVADEASLVAWGSKVKCSDKLLMNDDGTVDAPDGLRVAKCDQAHLPLKLRNISHHLWVVGTKYVDLKNFPEKLDGSMIVAANEQLKSMEGGPREITGDMFLTHSALESIDYMPETVGGSIDFTATRLKSLEGIHEKVKSMNGELALNDMSLESHLLGAVLIPGIKKINATGSVSADMQKAVEIINKALGEPETFDLNDLQEQLISAGLSKLAQI